MSPSFVPVLGTPRHIISSVSADSQEVGARWTCAQSHIAEKRQNSKADLLHSKALSRTTSPTSARADRN